MKLIEQNPVIATGVLVAVAVVIVAFVIGGDAQYDTLNFLPTTFDAVVDVLTPIFLVALLVERALEVFVGTGRKIGRADMDSALQKATDKIAQLKERLDVLQAQLDAPGAKNLTPVEIAAIHARRENVAKIFPVAQRNERNAKADVEKYRSETGRITFFAGAFIGLIIGLAGIRVVAPLVDFELAQWTAFQLFLFHSLDVILTAGLLAGGASGIHQIVATFGDFTDKTRRTTKKA